MRPADLHAADRYVHGSRARYVAGCRCAGCTRANVDAYHARQAAKRAAAPTVTSSGPPGEAILVRGGVRHTIRTCPGTGGAVCVRAPATWLRGTHDVCGACVERATVWNGDVSAAPARAHLQYLSGEGVGYKTVAAAAKLGVTVLAEVLAGRKTRIRARTARAVLAVTPAAVADHALVPAHATWDLIRRLLVEGLTRGHIANLLGREVPALQLRHTTILAASARQVKDLFDRIMDLGGAAPTDLPRVAAILQAQRSPRTVRELADELDADGTRREPARVVERVVRCLVRLRARGQAARGRGARQDRVRWYAAPQRARGAA